jgi:hypothetical protein
MHPREPSLQAFVLSLVVGVVCFGLSLAAPLRASGADTVPGRLGAAVFACRSTLDLREVDWIAANDSSASLPYYAVRARDGAVISVFGPGPAVLGAPFMEGLEEGAIITDLELERRARYAAALAVAFAATFLAGALAARTTPLRATAIALVTSLSFAGVSTLGQGLWQQTVFIVPLMAAVATIAWARWRGGALLALTPGLLVVAELVRPGAIFLVGAAALTWILAVWARPGRRSLVAVALPIAAVAAFPQLAWNATHTGDPLALRAYLVAHTSHGAGFTIGLESFVGGIAGLLFSPACGLLFFAPALLVALYAGMRHGDRAARVLGVGILFHMALVASYRMWWGGWSFGPRMLAESAWLAPLLVTRVPPTRILRTALAAAGIVTLAVGLFGTFCFEIGSWHLRRNPDLHHEALWDWIDSPLAAMLRRRPASTIDAPSGPYAYCVDRALERVRLVR